MALINKLNNIGDAIRAKTGKEDKLTLEQMVTEIAAIETSGSEPAVIEALVVTENGTYTPNEGVDGFSPVTVEVPTGGGGLPEEALVITGDCQYKFAGGGWNWFLENHGNQVTTQNITNASAMFYQNKTITEVPFDINLVDTYTGNVNTMFSGARKLRKLPYIKGGTISSFFNFAVDCYHLTTIPEDWADYIDFTTIHKTSNTLYHFFNYNKSLRHIPASLMKEFYCPGSSSSSFYYQAFSNCSVLEEVENLPIITTVTLSTNAFTDTFLYCSRLKKFTFATNEDGTPQVVKWKSQYINLSSAGYVYNTALASSITENHAAHGIGWDTAVPTQSYEKVKGNPNYWAEFAQYSLYNHDSAVETINSLPDASAYLSTLTSGTNTICFKGNAGESTDEGAINTLTAEEIAVAAAKGWTVSLI